MEALPHKQSAAITGFYSRYTNLVHPRYSLLKPIKYSSRTDENRDIDTREHLDILFGKRTIEGRW